MEMRKRNGGSKKRKEKKKRSERENQRSTIGADRAGEKMRDKTICSYKAGERKQKEKKLER